MKRIVIYCSIFAIGIVLILLAVFIDNSVIQTVFLSLGTGLLSSALTAGTIEISNYFSFSKKKKYIRNIELQHLSFDMLSLARLITREYDSKDITLLTRELASISITEENEIDVISLLNSQRLAIEREIKIIRENQNYLSLSECFTEQEISFLCRSINYYDKLTSKENAKYVIDNITNYLTLFKDTI